MYLTAAYLLSFLSSSLLPISCHHFLSFPIHKSHLICDHLISSHLPHLLHTPSPHSAPHHPPSTYTPKLKAIDRPQELEKVPRAPHDRKKEWQKLALGAELAQDVLDDKHREANGSAAYHDNRYGKVYL